MDDDFDGFKPKGAIDKKINGFLGLIEGLILDGVINKAEFATLEAWHEQSPDILARTPFNVLLPLLTDMLAHGSLNDEMKQRFLSLARELKSSKFYSNTSSDMQRLYGLLAGIICDGDINEIEIASLNTWLKDHDHLEDNISYQDIYEILRPIRTKKPFNDNDRIKLNQFITKHVDVNNRCLLKTNIVSTALDDDSGFYHGQIDIKGKTVCITGKSLVHNKAAWEALIISLGGNWSKTMKSTVDYLVICNEGSTHWVQANHGTKYIEAQKLQKKGSLIRIVTEDFFLDAIS